jgi:hypothetical protein
MSRRTVAVTPPSPGADPVPSGLSPWAVRTWTELLGLHEFAAHELVVFERALRWWDRSDAAADKGDMKLAMDANSSALRCWRTLRFPAPEGTTRRPGRPSGDGWNAQRRANGAARYA